MLFERIADLRLLQQRIAQLEHEIALERPRELADLPARLGYPDLRSFETALRTARGQPARPRGRPRRAGTAPVTAAAPAALDPARSSPAAAAPEPAPVAPAPRGLARAAETDSAAAPASSAPSPWPVCPPASALEPQGRSPLDYRQALQRLLAEAQKALHLPRMPAANWREWRQFERLVEERLRAQAF